MVTMKIIYEILYKSGYVLNLDLYNVKFDNIEQSGKGLGYDVVIHLTKSI